MSCPGPENRVLVTGHRFNRTPLCFPANSDGRVAKATRSPGQEVLASAEQWILTCDLDASDPGRWPRAWGQPPALTLEGDSQGCPGRTAVTGKGTV